jgi:hypothetical protein
MKFVSDCLTGKDNLTYDAGRVIGVLGALMYVAFWVVQVVATWRFTPGDADAYGRGLGMVLLAMAGRSRSNRIQSPSANYELRRARDDGGGADGVYRAQRRHAALAVRAP